MPSYQAIAWCPQQPPKFRSGGTNTKRAHKSAYGVLIYGAERPERTYTCSPANELSLSVPEHQENVWCPQQPQNSGSSGMRREHAQISAYGVFFNFRHLLRGSRPELTYTCSQAKVLSSFMPCQDKRSSARYHACEHDDPWRSLFPHKSWKRLVNDRTRR